MAPVKELALRLRFGGFQFSHVKASFLEPKDTSTLLLSLWRKASPFSGRNQRLFFCSGVLASTGRRKPVPCRAVNRRAQQRSYTSSRCRACSDAVHKCASRHVEV